MPLDATSLLNGYPIYNGSKKIQVLDLKGPSSYSTGGETLQAAQFGQGGIDFMLPMNGLRVALSDDVGVVSSSFSGTYFVTISVGTGTVGSVTSVTIKWYNVSDGAEVTATTDLSAEKVRVLVIFV